MDTPAKIGRYEILEELGRGAMGIVYRAKDPAMDRVVAVKTIISVALASPQGSEFRERFYREARTAGGLNHPGVVAVFDVGEHDGMPFLVMEFVAGRTLADSAKAGERLSVDRICEFGGQIAEALAYAHQRGVVHRDIKPANVLLTSAEAYGIERTKITDFGVAKLAEGQTTLTGQMLGTPAFMPPEQFTGAPIDGRSDIFSLGVVLYWMATGERPFPGESITAVSYKVVHTDPVPPVKLNPSLPPKLESIILRCLAKNPADRFQTGYELGRELTELKNGGKTSASGVYQQTTIQRGFGVGDPDATHVETTPAVPAVATATQGLVPVASGRKRERTLVLVAVIAVLLVAAVGYALRSRPTPIVEAPAPSPASISEAPAAVPAEPAIAAAPAPEKPKTIPATASVATPAPSPVASAKAEPKEPTRIAEATVDKVEPEPSPVDFDPKALDRRQNARVEIDASRMPPDLDFTVEMNGKVYVRKTGPNPYKETDALYVPPGVHEFRVAAHNGDVEKVSNTVSTEFRANKRNTLKIELRLQGKTADAGMPRGLYPSSQIVLTLK
jgi:serine/threonine-protein kinase